MSDNLDLFGCDPEVQGFEDSRHIGGMGDTKKALPVLEYADIEEYEEDHQPSLAAAMPWEPPQPIFATIEPLPYPIESLPPLMRDAVQEVADFVQAPLPMVALSAMAALSMATQAHVDVRRANRLEGPCSLFMLAIADSGERKSTCDSFFSQPIKDYERKQAIAAMPDIKNYEAALGAWEAKRSGIKERIKSATKAKKNEEVNAASIDLTNLEHDKPEPPRVPRLTYGDATPEALIDGLATKWPSGGVVSSEAGIVFGSHGMGGESLTRNLSTLNQCWDGFTPRIDRKTSACIEAKRVRLTMALLVQESTLMAFIEKTGGLARGTGFFARFLLAWPESTQGTRLFREASKHWPALEAFNGRVAQILDQPVHLTEHGDLEPQVLELTPEAKAHWVAHYNATERELGNGGELHEVSDIASKSADQAARIAALFHVLEGGAGSIGLDAMERACDVAQWHLGESLRFFSEVSAPAGLADAARLDAWLIKSGEMEQSKNHVRRFGPIRDGDRLNVAIEELRGLDRLRVSVEGKKTTLVINPALTPVATATVATLATQEAKKSVLEGVSSKSSKSSKGVGVGKGEM